MTTEEEESWVLYAYDVIGEELIEIDEASDFIGGKFNGETIIYSTHVSDDVDDVETRRFDLVSRAGPQVIYEGAIALVPAALTP